MRKALLLCVAIGLINAVVEFTNSALYDIYDFKGTTEVHVSKCDNGCLIFAATEGEGFVQYPGKLDPYAMNLMIVDHNDGRNTYSLAKLAQQRDDKQRKMPLTVTGRGNISVVNQNAPTEKVFWTVLLYVIEKAKADEFKSYEVYDVTYTQGTKFTPQADIVTFMGGWMFRVRAGATTQSNSVTARLTGFDNALDNNKDGCPYAYKSPDAVSFPGFTINSNPQMISFVIGKRGTVQFSIDLQYTSLPVIGTDGFIASPGWNGCTKANNGAIQSFRTQNDLDTDAYIFMDTDAFNVTLDVLPNFDAKHTLVIENRQDINRPAVVNGTLEQFYTFSYTTNTQIMFENMKGDQGFLLRYSSNPIPRPTEASEPCTTSRPTVTTPSHTYPTTSSACAAIGWMISTLLLSMFL